MADPHCKTPAHLRVTVTPAQLTKRVTATYLSPMACHNQPTREDWGVVLSIRKDRLAGVHLRPDAVAWLPGQLRANAGSASGTQTVTVSHTIGGVLEHFVSVTPAAARVLADAIDAAAGVGR